MIDVEWIANLLLLSSGFVWRWIDHDHISLVQRPTLPDGSDG